MTDVKPNNSESNRHFAEERSYRDSNIANENARATGQAAILINGGAATAILAFLAKGEVNSSAPIFASYCLVGYAFGVVFGALMMFCLTDSIRWWNIFWTLSARNGDANKIARACKRAKIRMRVAYMFFAASIMSFLLASVAMAYALYP